MLLDFEVLNTLKANFETPGAAYLNESPMFLALKGRNHEARHVVEDMGRPGSQKGLSYLVIDGPILKMREYSRLFWAEAVGWLGSRRWVWRIMLMVAPGLNHGKCDDPS